MRRADPIPKKLDVIEKTLIRWEERGKIRRTVPPTQQGATSRQRSEPRMWLGSRNSKSRHEPCRNYGRG